MTLKIRLARSVATEDWKQAKILALLILEGVDDENAEQAERAERLYTTLAATAVAASESFYKITREIISAIRERRPSDGIDDLRQGIFR